MHRSVGTICGRCSTRCAGAPWRLLAHDLPPWQMLYQQFRRWDEAGCFEAMVNDMRSVIRVSEGRRDQPSAVICARRFRRPPARRSSWRGRTKATPASRPGRTPRPARSTCRSSNCPRRGRALSCCHDAGWSSAVSAGCRAFVGSAVISSACLRCWPACTSSSSPSSCSPRPQR